QNLDGIAVTDHDTIKGGIETKKIAEGIEIIVGAEIRTDRGEIIGYFLQEEIKSRILEEVIDEIKSQEGITCIPHPYDIFRIYRLAPTKEIAKHIDWIEVFNSRCMLQEFNEKALGFALENNLEMSAGSDAHSLAEIGAGGIIIGSLEDLRGNLSPTIFGRKASLLNLLAAKLKKML
ncbi:MAG: PHP domain-containing protein, partial [Euryarchaeota archaeon]|nr:PHP domain-containing protein [Euryarchaeota archaeon]